MGGFPVPDTRYPTAWQRAHAWAGPETLKRGAQAAGASAAAFCVGAAVPLLAAAFIHDYVWRLVSLVRAQPGLWSSRQGPWTFMYPVVLGVARCAVGLCWSAGSQRQCCCITQSPACRVQGLGIVLEAGEKVLCMRWDCDDLLGSLAELLKAAGTRNTTLWLSPIRAHSVHLCSVAASCGGSMMSSEQATHLNHA